MNYSIEELLNALEHDDPIERRYAAEDLGEFGDPGAVPALIKALDDPDRAVREAAADALINISGEEVVKAVVPLLYSEVVHLRNYATEVLAQLGSEAIPALLQECESENADVRKFAIDVLGQLGEVHRIPDIQPILKLLNDENVNVAASAAEALGRIGDPDAIPELAKYLDGPPWLQCNVLHAISQIGGKQARETLEQIDPEKLASEAKYYYGMALKHLNMDKELSHVS